jgi:hypothetical protein
MVRTRERRDGLKPFVNKRPPTSHTLQAKAMFFTETGESFVAMTLKDNARGEDVDPITVNLSLNEAAQWASALWELVGDIRRADATGRKKTP